MPEWSYQHQKTLECEFYQVVALQLLYNLKATRRHRVALLGTAWISSFKRRGNRSERLSEDNIFIFGSYHLEIAG